MQTRLAPEVHLFPIIRRGPSQRPLCGAVTQTGEGGPIFNGNSGVGFPLNPQRSFKRWLALTAKLGQRALCHPDRCREG